MKENASFDVRRDVLIAAFLHIKRVLSSDPELQLILVHGAGGGIHKLAHTYKLREGTGAHPDGVRGAILTRNATQKLNTEIVSLAVDAGILATSVHTGSIVTQKEGIIETFDTSQIEYMLREGYVPILYGEMVYDTALGMTVCSGDTIVAHLAKSFPVSEIYFASDVDGICTDDPHVHKNVEIIPEISITEALDGTIQLTGSHNIDVTDGLRGKIESCRDFFENSNIHRAHIFNGCVPENYFYVLQGKSFTHSIIKK